MPDQPPTPPIPPREEPIRIFVSYAREDRKWLDPAYAYNLIPYLADSLRRQGVTFWFDNELRPGDEYKRLIESEIDKAQIALLIVSQNFLNSEFIETFEMPRIAARAHHGEMLVVPVLVEPCDWSDYPFLADRQMVPSANPLIDFTESSAQWARVKFQILDGLKAQIKRIRESLRQTELQHLEEHRQSEALRQAEDEKRLDQQRRDREEQERAEQENLEKQRVIEEKAREEALAAERRRQEEQDKRWRAEAELQAQRQQAERIEQQRIEAERLITEKAREEALKSERRRQEEQQQPIPEPEPVNASGASFKIIVSVLAAVFVFVVVGLGWMLTRKSPASVPTQRPAVTQASTETAAAPSNIGVNGSSVALSGPENTASSESSTIHHPVFQPKPNISTPAAHATPLPSKPSGPARIAAGVMASQILVKTPPVYPPIARAAHMSGSVVLHAIISTTGTIEGLTAVSGSEILQGAALDAVRQWRYKPYLLNGEPTEVDTTITVNFNLNDSAGDPQPSTTHVSTSPSGNFVAQMARQSCDKGWPDSCENLAHFYQNGSEGLSADSNQAHAYFAKACKLGNASACSQH